MGERPTVEIGELPWGTSSVSVVPLAFAKSSSAAEAIRRLWAVLDRPPTPRCGNCDRGPIDHGPAPDFRCPPIVTSADLFQAGDGE